METHRGSIGCDAAVATRPSGRGDGGPAADGLARLTETSNFPPRRLSTMVTVGRPARTFRGREALHDELYERGRGRRMRLAAGRDARLP